MPTREQVLAIIRIGQGYEEAGRALGVPAGQAYLVATGVPADGSGGPAPDDPAPEGLLDGSSQHLSNPPAENPTHKEHVLAWVRGRAGSDGQMAAAAAGRTPQPAPIDEDERPDAIEMLTRRHNQVDALVKQLKTLPGVTKGGTPAQQAQRKVIVDLISARLSRHEAAEQEHFWPEVRRALPDGERRAGAALDQEREGSETLARLARLSPADEQFDELAEQLATQAHAHVAFEDRVFLDVAAAVPEEDRRRIGAALHTAHEEAGLPSGGRPPS